MTTESLQAPPGDESGQVLQYLPFATSQPPSMPNGSLLMKDLPIWAKPVLAKQMPAEPAADAAATSEAGGPADPIGCAQVTLTTGRVRAARNTAAQKTQPAMQALGFTNTRSSKRAAWRVVTHPQFKRFFIGSLITNWGTWLQNTAQILLAYQFSHSVLTVGLVTCAQFSTPLFCGPWASVVTHRIGVQRTLIITQIASALITAVMAGLELTHSLSQPLLFLGAFLVGLMFTFALPAQSALIPTLVPDDAAEIKAAVVMNSVSYNAGRMVAPACTVLIVMATSFWCVFALNAVTFAIFAGILRNLKTLSDPSPQGKSRIRDGLSVVRDDSRIIILLLIVAAVTLAEDPVLVLGPGLTRHGFHLSFDYSGYFLCALGLGSVISSLLPRRSSTSVRRAAAALGALSVSIMIFALAPWMWLSVGAAAAAGLSGVVAGTTAQAMLRQLAGPQRTLQVMGLWAVAWAGSKPIASLLDGSLPSIIPMRATGILLAIPALLPPLALLICPQLTKRVINKHTAHWSHKPSLCQPSTEFSGAN